MNTRIAEALAVLTAISTPDEGSARRDFNQQLVES